MEEQKYAVSDGNVNNPRYNIKRMEIEEMPKQMLIGYMVEYLIAKEQEIYLDNCVYHKDRKIEDVYNYLKLAIYATME